MIDLTPEETLRVLTWYVSFNAEQSLSGGYVFPADLLLFKRLDDEVQAHYPGMVRL